MKTYFIILVLALFTLQGFAQDQTKSTYYLIRHAEKDRSDKTNKDPALTKEGRERAMKWMDVLGKFNINAIYSTNYNRTEQTVGPLAFTQGLQVNIYHPIKIDYQKFILETKGKNVVVVGHSNTTANFANKLIGKEVYVQIEDNNNANLYIVTIKGEHISHVLIKME